MRTIAVAIEVSDLSEPVSRDLYRRVCSAVCSLVGPDVSVIVSEVRHTVTAHRLTRVVETDGPYVEVKYGDLSREDDPVGALVKIVQARIEEEQK